MTTKNIYNKSDNSPLFVGIYITVFIVLLFLLSDNYKSPELRYASLFIAGVSLIVALKAFQIQLSSNMPNSPAQQYINHLIEESISSQQDSTQQINMGDVNIKISDSSNSGISGESQEVIDVIFEDRVDWTLLSRSLGTVKVENGGEDFSIQAIENKGNGDILIKVNVPTNANKVEIEKALRQKYQLEQAVLEIERLIEPLAQEYSDDATVVQKAVEQIEKDPSQAKAISSLIESSLIESSSQTVSSSKVSLTTGAAVAASVGSTMAAALVPAASGLVIAVVSSLLASSLITRQEKKKQSNISDFSEGKKIISRE